MAALPFALQFVVLLGALVSPAYLQQCDQVTKNGTQRGFYTLTVYPTSYKANTSYTGELAPRAFLLQSCPSLSRSLPLRRGGGTLYELGIGEMTCFCHFKAKYVPVLWDHRQRCLLAQVLILNLC